MNGNRGLTQSGKKLDKFIFWPSAIITVLVLALMIIYEKKSLEVVNFVLEFSTNSLGFVFTWGGVIFLGAILWMSFGRYSNVRLGGENARPEFSRISWIAMFFCSGIGTSLIYWSSIEWAYHYIDPPFGIEPKSEKALSYSAMYGLFHYGPIAWAFLCITAFPVGYAYYNRKLGKLRLSTACSGIIGKKNAEGIVAPSVRMSVAPSDTLFL